jgi:hypothetical protein
MNMKYGYDYKISCGAIITQNAYIKIKSDLLILKITDERSIMAKNHVGR